VSVSPLSPAPNEARNAVAAGVVCYLMWGFIPLAFQQMAAHGATPWEILAHRAVWGVPMAILLVAMARQWDKVIATLRDKRTMGWLALSSLFIAVNWITYISAVNGGRALETSLGYYLNPLLNMAAGAWLFKERLSGPGKIAVVLAGIGVVIQAIALGHMPWVSLILATSFAIYGIIRKRISADAQTGLLVECLVLSLPGLAFVIWGMTHGDSHFLNSPATTAWLVFAGPLTVVPLALFAWAARRMPLSTMGFLQYLAPTIVFVIGTLQGEPLGLIRIISFGFIWAAVTVFVIGAVRTSRRKPHAPIVSEPEPGLVEPADEGVPLDRSR
jgi:chloramphenicol-sensitive protein RarD